MLDDLDKKLALSAALTKARDKGVEVDSLEEVEHAFHRVDEAVRTASEGDMGLIEFAKRWNFFDEKPPLPPYDLVRFDDQREADDFCARVLRFHGLSLLSERIPGGKLIRVKEAR